MHPGRRSLRLKDYDYAQEGVYCVTICTHERACLFGTVNAEAVVELSMVGQVVADCWHAISNHFPQVELDAFVIMPNHIHGIVIISHRRGVEVGAQHVAPLQATFDSSNVLPHVSPGSLGAIVRCYKAAVTRLVRGFPGMSQVNVWQRNYYEQIVRNERTLNALRQYIESNPANWLFDENNPGLLQ